AHTALYTLPRPDALPIFVVTDVSTKLHLQLNPVVFDNVAATRQAFFSGRCDALITDAAALASVRATQSDNPDDYVIFPATKYMRSEEHTSELQSRANLGC